MGEVQNEDKQAQYQSGYATLVQRNAKALSNFGTRQPITMAKDIAKSVACYDMNCKNEMVFCHMNIPTLLPP